MLGGNRLRRPGDGEGNRRTLAGGLRDRAGAGAPLEGSVLFLHAGISADRLAAYSCTRAPETGLATPYSRSTTLVSLESGAARTGVIRRGYYLFIGTGYIVGTARSAQEHQILQ